MDDAIKTSLQFIIGLSLFFTCVFFYAQVENDYYQVCEKCEITGIKQLENGGFLESDKYIYESTCGDIVKYRRYYEGDIICKV